MVDRVGATDAVVDDGFDVKDAVEVGCIEGFPFNRDGRLVGGVSKVVNGGDGIAVPVGCADGAKEGTGNDGVGDTVSSHSGPSNPSGQTHPNAPIPLVTHSPPFLCRQQK